MKNLGKFTTFFFVMMMVFTACSPQEKSTTIKGTVLEIQAGKDGYTAKIKTSDEQFYFVTISRANLSDPAQYKVVENGDIIEVKGDQWEMEGEKHVTVRELN